MPASFEIRVLGDVQLARRIDRFVEEVKDFRPVWDDVADEFWSIEKEQFDTEGHGRWEPLSPRYAAWKAIHYPGRPILQRELFLKNAVTGGKDSVKRSERFELRLGWKGVSYWRYHQTGTAIMPARKVVDLREQDKREIMKAVHRGIIRALGRLR